MDKDNSFNEIEDVLPQDSLSLISYGSEVADSSFESSNVDLDEVPNLPLVEDVPTDLGQCKALPPTQSEERDIILSVAKQLGFSGVSLEKLHELNAACEKLKASEQKYLQNKITFDAVVNVSKKKSALPVPSAHKVNQVLQRISVLDCITSPEEESEANSGVFGISKEDVDGYFRTKLSSVDKKYLREAVSKELSDRHNKVMQLDKRFSDTLSKLSGPSAGNKGVELDDTQRLLSLRRDLDSEISANVSYIKDLDQVLSDLAQLKLKDVQSLNNDKLNYFSTQCEALKQQIRSFNLQIIRGIYREDKHLIDAYTKLKQTLDLAVDEAKKELCMLQKKEAEYDKLSGTHFDALVREFNHLKNQIAEKEYALRNLLT